jgi:hypothetical protein
MNCGRCEQEASRPINVTIRDPDHDGEISFCSWECAAIWFNAQAGERS